MKRIFISHSSSDKAFYAEHLVKALNNSLGKDKIVFDAHTFEEGAKINLEISEWIEKTDLFVLLLSNKALESEWVQKEIMQSEFLELSNPDEERIFPIIIDPNINHEDNRIPEWLKQYNIRMITSPKKAARQIISRAVEISWMINPRIKEKNNLYVGRNDKMEEFEDRMDNFNSARPNILIASGINSIGRRSFLKRGLIKIDVIKESYSMPILVLDGHQSIENLILSIEDLGYSNINTENLMTKTIEEKIDIAYQILLDVNNSKDIILIEDEGAIVSHYRELTPWFVELSKKIAKSGEFNDVVLCIASKYKPMYKLLYSLPNIFSLQIDELSKKDRSRLLMRYSKLIGLNINNEDLESISNYLTGLPEEVFFSAEVAKAEGIHYLKENTDIITNFGDDKVIILLSEYNDDEVALQILKLISLFDFISIETLNNLLNKEKKYLKYIEKFLAGGICSFIGSRSEYLIMNTAIKNYFSRQHLKLNKEFEQNVSTFVKSSMETKDTYFDYADRTFIFQQKLKLSSEISDEMLIPSFYLKTMKDLYDSKSNDKDVIQLADKVLEASTFLDPYILSEIRFYLCSALARQKLNRFNEEIRHINGAQHNFLYGFYYRHIGNYEKAIDRLLSSLDEYPNYAQAKRELVLLYNKTENYEKAFDMAKENYENNRSNEYHIHAYYQVLSYERSSRFSVDEKKPIMEKLLKDIEIIPSDKAKNMYLIMSAQYELYMNDNIEGAEVFVEKADNLFPDSIYVLLFKIDFFEKTGNLRGLESVLKSMNKFNSKNSSYYTDFVKCKIFIEALKGNQGNANSLINKINLNERAKKALRNKVQGIMKVEI
ncbi:hypothetical protein ATZ33_11875 [Enterococcus silesiacus]|uniref:TIR domain-containing protein n=1 Tax=Enterococcus silesiacus TaxID=332949 RepID=A0A0S3KDB4_9ENTE|nr:toll/interleukin-1 receptor domain-containing protein [Enterococcus silesiacus]ALS02057.1 hypothetical protein ATZ33_11875 [Enterococcus silesiacus]OJG84898.1 hypothetical protein RV15_GL002876 [Enterococcus silesiacus]